jgi:mannose-6-phosphate isomerase
MLSTASDTAPSTLTERSGSLPYLLKVLAAAEALSLQTHPSAEQAAAGYAREEQLGIAVDAPERIYRDPFAKPELICALTRFDALCGFRPIDATLALLDRLGATGLAAHLRSEGLAATVAALYRRTLAIDATLAACADRPEPEATLVMRLAGQYPDDPSVVVTLLLNRVVLEPGEALFLGPGNLHAYLHGVGVEIMGASDNVVRGGTTVKHVDIDELLRVMVIDPLTDPRSPATSHGAGAWSYDTPGTPFRLWRYEIDGAFVHTATGRELLLCTAGSTDRLGRGAAAYLSPGERVELRGRGTVFRVEEVPTA